MKTWKILYCRSFFASLILWGLHTQAANLNSASCYNIRMEQVADFQFVSSVLSNQSIRTYIQKKGGLKSVWPQAQLCSDSSNLNKVLKITLAFSSPGGDYVSWGWDYCQLDVALKGTSVINFRELRCDSPMDY